MISKLPNSFHCAMRCSTYSRISFPTSAEEEQAKAQFIRYIRAFEVARDPHTSKYEVAVKLRTLKNGPAIRNNLRLPHPVKANIRIAVICPANSKIAEQAKAAGAALVGEEEIFDAVRAGNIDFERCVCHVDSMQKLSKANLGRQLGPKGLMPSAKTGTVVKDVASTVKNLTGGAGYKEKLGVVRMAIGQLAFTPEQMQNNIRTFMDYLKRDINLLSDRISKEVHEVVSLRCKYIKSHGTNGD
jgi:large subunit ribosomal protein L1